MQASFYKNRYVVPAIHAKGPRDYYATFCIDDGKKNQCFTIRPNFQTEGQAREAAYKTGRAKVDTLIEESMWVNLMKKFKQIRKQPANDKRSKNTIYLS